MDFFHPWPRQALISVAARFLEDVELGDSSVKESLAVHMAEEHLSVTKVSFSRLGLGVRVGFEQVIIFRAFALGLPGTSDASAKTLSAVGACSKTNY